MIRIKELLVIFLCLIIISEIALVKVLDMTHLRWVSVSKKELVRSKIPFTLPTETPTPTPTLTPTPIKLLVKQYSSASPQSGKNVDNSLDPWGVAKQVGEYSWTMKVGQDTRMATAQEIFEALNLYRQRLGSGTLSWDDKLASYAQERAEYFENIRSLDSHKGFNDYLNNQDGFKKLGFYQAGENSSYGYQLLGVHIIEWIYAGDKPHNDNQLNKQWSHVGIGVKGTSTELIFGGSKM